MWVNKSEPRGFELTQLPCWVYLKEHLNIILGQVMDINYPTWILNLAMA
jgi:hypothetical protein